MSCRRYVLLPCILLLCLACPCLAAEQQAKRVLCGDYSYILPEGFSAFDMPQFDGNNIYLNRDEYDAFAQAKNRVVCIQKEKTDNKSFIIEHCKILQAKKVSPNVNFFKAKQFEEVLKNDARVYYDAYYVYDGIISWTSLLVEMNSNGSAKHTIFYFSSDYPERKIKKGRRTVTVKMSHEDIKKIALEFIDSIQKVR